MVIIIKLSSSIFIMLVGCRPCIRCDGDCFAHTITKCTPERGGAGVVAGGHTYLHKQELTFQNAKSIHDQGCF